MDINRVREVHFARMQRVLEEGLTNINLAQNPAEADAARNLAQVRLEELNRMFQAAFPQEDSLLPAEMKQPV